MLRALAPVVALLTLALLPVAASQSAVLPLAPAVIVTPPERAVEPLGDAVEVPLALELRCGPHFAQPVTVQWTVARLPAWSTVVVEPSTDSAGVDRCEGGPSGVLRFEATAYVEASTLAPAFYAEALEVEAVATHPLSGTATARGSAPLIASFFSILDVDAPARQLPGGEGLAAAFPLRITNHGNANTKVTFTAVSADGVAVDLPEPIVLQSRQAGGHTIREDVLVKAHPLRETDRPLSFLVRWTSSYALDAQLVGDSGEIELVVLPGRGTEGLTALEGSAREDDRQEVPGLGTLGAAVAIGVAALALRRR